MLAISGFGKVARYAEDPSCARHYPVCHLPTLASAPAIRMAGMFDPRRNPDLAQKNGRNVRLSLKGNCQAGSLTRLLATPPEHGSKR